MKPVFILQVDSDKNCEVWVIDSGISTVASGTISDFKLDGHNGKNPMDAPVDVVMTGKWSIKEIIEKPAEIKTVKEKKQGV